MMYLSGEKKNHIHIYGAHIHFDSESKKGGNINEQGWLVE
jgi:hypothetical protein